ncbi:hypothetical protein PVAND_003538 [Polypedilum vanderplanki]|uniref:Calcineurin-like phosphoesterase domain-containing protein n=1 Tax=Polypedilum vanderplanki TaxID=319348 RepID=A0A9J6BW51_POLVA|nr:hypothetical protein PVAND_003538 [Polypedilum vanderplanki]
MFKRIFKFFLKLLRNFIVTFIFCEFLIYYVVIYQCNYKSVDNENINDGLKAMILADTHMLGPFKGHPFDRLRREWQMKRSFQTAMQIFKPDVVFILGDVFDEGNWVNDKQYQEYVDRFHTLFYVPSTTRLYAILGNHDVNFHYAMHPHLVNRFSKAFNFTSGVNLIREKKVTADGTKRIVNFVTINSMAMEGDECYLCHQAKEALKSIGKKLEILKQKNRHSPPFVMQHFPTYRNSDENCIEIDSENTDITVYREKWEVLSKSASEFIAKTIEPRGYFSGHTHRYCMYGNDYGIYEHTIASFNWRNINMPSFLLAVFTPDDYSISKCDMPKETTVIICYIVGTIMPIIFAIINCKYPMRNLVRNFLRFSLIRIKFSPAAGLSG